MRILLLTQAFYPDTVSVSQHAEDLAVELAEAGYEIDVYTSRYTYEKNIDLKEKFIEYKGVNVYRLTPTKFSKKSYLGRIINFLTFNIVLFLKVLFSKKGKYDMIIGMTLPPFISTIGAFCAKIKKAKFCFWMMDVQPGISIGSGLMKKDSLIARIMQSAANYIGRNSDLIFALDRFMKDHLIEEKIKSEKIKVVPVWPPMSKVYEGTRMENPFRIEHGFGDKIVIMYSGNHAVMHPLDTILDVALELRDDPRFLFVFIGGGVRVKDVTEFREKHQLGNIRQLPFQPREIIHQSLGSADLQLVILGEGQVGYTHPNKVYGAIFIGKPIIYIGPQESHVTDITKNIQGNIEVALGQVKELVSALKEFAELGEAHWDRVGQHNLEFAHKNFMPSKLKSEMVTYINQELNDLK
ncbi:glycosyltransferase family 4 protein [Saprospiraceae bacterium]|nr:glycosyltransferase family 4 protein [Saprospiraceae bacterium]